MRVWDLALAPGEALPGHMHRPDCWFVVQGGELRHVHPNDPGQDRAVRYEEGQVVFLEAGTGLLHHRPVNVGDQPYRKIVVEPKER